MSFLSTKEELNQKYSLVTEPKTVDQIIADVNAQKKNATLSDYVNASIKNKTHDVAAYVASQAVPITTKMEATKPDWQEKSKYVSTEKGNAWDKLWTTGSLGYGDVQYEYINNQNDFRTKYDDAIKSEALFGLVDWENDLQAKNYHLMTPDEVAMYNYWYATKGKDEAQEYLDVLSSELTKRGAQERYENELQGNTFNEIMFGFESGLHNFGEGFASAFTPGKKRPVTETQLVAGAVREDLADDGFKLPDWMGGGSIAQVGFDATSSIGNMLPAIAAGTVNPLLGATLTGASATGNAYQAALQQGYDHNQAALYGVLVGASEAGLQYAMGGIKQLGASTSIGQKATAALGKMDNALGNFAAKFGNTIGGKVFLNGLSEGAEEGLQAVLEPFFKSIALGEDFTVETEEALYSALLGFFMGAGFAFTDADTYKKAELPTANLTESELLADVREDLDTDLETVFVPSQKVDIGKDIQAEPGSLNWVLELAQLGEVTNSQAENIVNATNVYDWLLETAGIESPETKAGKRKAVKQAVAQIEQQQTKNNNQINIDNANNVTYNNNINGGEQIERTAGTGEDQGGISGVYGGRGTMDQGRSERSGTPVGTGFVLLSPSSQAVLESRGVVNLELRDSSMDNAAFSVALENARNADTGHGWAVTPKTAEELTSNGVRTFMTENGSTGFAIAPDGDIEAVFANKAAGAPKGSTKYTIPLAIANGGTKLDCYGDGLVALYAKYGFVPVAKTAFNPEYANLGWTADKGNPDIYFMMHNGESADTVVQNYGSYHIPTKAELDALPVMEYDDAYAYRDGLLEQQTAQAAQTAKDGVIYQPTSDTTTTQNAQQSLNAAAPYATVRPNESVGAAPSGFDPNSNLQYKYGTMPEGENPVRPDDLPVRDVNGNKISLSARTVKGAKVTPDSFEPLLNKQATGGRLSYVEITNNDTVQKAMDSISENGWEQSLGAWKNNVENGKASPEMVATGALLLNNAAQAGDVNTWLDILYYYQDLSTNLGQSLQAMRILKTLEPSDKLYMIRKSVQKIAKELGYDVEIDSELAKKYQEAATDQEADKILDQIAENIAKQIKTTWGEKFTALRYLNMLGNVRTQIRNVAGNITMGALNKIKNSISTTIELAANKISGGKIERTKSYTVSKAQMKAAKATYDALVEQAISSGGKYNDPNANSDAFMQKVNDAKTIFKFKPLEAYRIVTKLAMEKGDILFSKPAYARALAGYLKAKGYTTTDYSTIPEKVLDGAMVYAIKEAQEVTFRDNNELSKWVSKLGRGKKANKIEKIIAEGIIPYRKTPANVLLRAEQYSPLGFINATIDTVKAAKGVDTVTANMAIEAWSRALTGTGMFALGMLLFNSGLLNVSEDDEQEAAFNKMNGIQPYSLNIGGYTYTIDWASPAAIPFLMGGEFAKAIGEDGFQLEDLTDALTSIADPMVEMSMLQGVNDTLDNVKYSDDPLAQLLINAALSYVSQGLGNTLLGQIERSTEENRMQTYIDKESGVPSWLQSWLGKLSAKTPVWDYQQIPYIDAWGREQKNRTGVDGLLYNTLSPGYIAKVEDDAVSQELLRLDKAQGKNVFPPSAPKYYTKDGEKVNFTAEEYVEVAKLRGQTQRQIVEDLVESESYKNLSDDEKADVLQAVYDFALDYALTELHDADKLPKWYTEKPEEMTDAEAILRYKAAGSSTKYADVPIETAVYTVDLIKNLQPETGAKEVRPIQKLEAVVNDSSLDEYAEYLLLEIAEDSVDSKYYAAKKQGYDPDEFVEAYRIYLDERDKGGKGTKERTIKEIQKELRISYEAAEKLYEVYN